MNTRKEKEQAYIETQKAEWDRYLAAMTEAERAALAERIFNTIHPKDDWHDDKPDPDAAGVRELANEARYGLDAQPQTWRNRP